MNHLQKIWNKLSPDGRKAIDDWTRTNTELEQATFDTYSTILSDIEHNFSSNDFPEYCLGSILVGNELNGPSSFKCLECKENFPLDADYRPIEEVMLYHAITKHVNSLLPYLNEKDAFVLNSASSGLKEHNTTKDDKLLEKISFAWNLLTPDWQDAVSIYIDENISLARTTRDILSIEFAIGKDGKITLSHNEIDDIQVTLSPQCNIHGEIAVIKNDITNSLIAHVLLEDIGTIITMNSELPQEYITAAHNELTTFLKENM
jgi:hypothetical protein